MNVAQKNTDNMEHNISPRGALWYINTGVEKSMVRRIVTVKG